MTEKLTLVTGAPGWLGTRFIEALVHGLPDVPGLSEPDPERKIRCLVLEHTPVGVLRDISANIEIVEGDVRDPASLEPFFENARGAVVFHLSGIIHPRRVRDFYDINFQGSRHVLDGAVSAGARRFVAVSSNSPAGCNDSPEQQFDEASPSNPYMNYGMSKLQMEEAVQEAFEAGMIETVILRPCWIYGPQQPERQSRFFRMIREGKAPIVGSGACRRSLSYVDNVCQGLLLAERVEAARGRLYWIADRSPYTMNEIIDTVAQVMARDFGMEVSHQRLHFPDITSDLALLADKVMQGLGLYNQEMHVLSEMNKTIACSVSRAEQELGYDPRIELEEGMRRSIQWCLDHGQRI